MPDRPDKNKDKEQYSSKDIIFKDGKLRVTQLYGNNPEFYSKYGLKAHEGMDFGYTSEDWTLFSPVDGYVWVDTDIVRDGYGNYVAIVCPKDSIVIFFCHLDENYVRVNDLIKVGAPIGKMGNTGNSSGAHLHLMLFEFDKNPANRKNVSNGYKGMLDPLPYVKKWLNMSGVMHDIIFDERYINKSDINRVKG